jgi:hypothetical protein
MRWIGIYWCGILDCFFLFITPPHLIRIYLMDQLHSLPAPQTLWQPLCLQGGYRPELPPILVQRFLHFLVCLCLPLVPHFLKNLACSIPPTHRSPIREFNLKRNIDRRLMSICLCPFLSLQRVPSLSDPTLTNLHILWDHVNPIDV